MKVILRNSMDLTKVPTQPTKELTHVKRDTSAYSLTWKQDLAKIGATRKQIKDIAEFFKRYGVSQTKVVLHNVNNTEEWNSYRKNGEVLHQCILRFGVQFEHSTHKRHDYQPLEVKVINGVIVA